MFATIIFVVVGILVITKIDSLLQDARYNRAVRNAKSRQSK